MLAKPELCRMIVGLVVVARIPFQSWRKAVIPLGLLSVAAMAAPFAPGPAGGA